MTTGFQNYCQKHPNLRNFIFAQNFEVQKKFKSPDFKYDKIIFKFQPKYIQIRSILVLYLRYFGFTYFFFHCDKFESADFKHDNIFWGVLFLQESLCFEKFEVASIVTIVFFKCQRKNTQIIHLPKFKDFYFVLLSCIKC